MTLKRSCAWAAVAACLAFAGSPVSAEIHDYVHNGSGIAITGVPYVGRTLTASGVPAGATCAWIQGGSTVSTSCTSYTLAATGPITLQVTTAGKTTYTALSIAGSCGTTATVGSAYSGCTGIAASNGSGGYTYMLSGSWPAGISIAPSTGTVSGTPTTAGTYANISIAATDSVGGSASITPFTLTVASGGGGGSPSLDFSQAGNSQYVAVVF